MKRIMTLLMLGMVGVQAEPIQEYLLYEAGMDAYHTTSSNPVLSAPQSNLARTLQTGQKSTLTEVGATMPGRLPGRISSDYELLPFGTEVSVAQYDSNGMTMFDTNGNMIMGLQSNDGLLHNIHANYTQTTGDGRYVFGGDYTLSLLTLDVPAGTPGWTLNHVIGGFGSQVLLENAMHYVMVGGRLDLNLLGETFAGPFLFDTRVGFNLSANVSDEILVRRNMNVVGAAQLHWSWIGQSKRIVLGQALALDYQASSKLAVMYEQLLQYTPWASFAGATQSLQNRLSIDMGIHGRFKVSPRFAVTLGWRVADIAQNVDSWSLVVGAQSRI